jgi:hypothetical protein
MTLFISQLLCKGNSLQTGIKRKKEISGDSYTETFTITTTGAHLTVEARRYCRQTET